MTDRRSALTDRMADFLLANGPNAASLRPLAAAAGISDRMLLYYFKDKAMAMTAAFDCVQRRFHTALADQAQPRPLPIGRMRGKIVLLLLDDALWPYMQLWLDVSALASRGDPVQRDRAQALWHALHNWVQGQLVGDAPNQRARLMMMIQAAVQQQAIGLRDAAADTDAAVD